MEVGHYIATINNGTTIRPTLWSSTAIINSADRQLSMCEKPLDTSFENIAYAIFMSLLLLTSFVGNSLVIIATFLSKQLRKRVTVYLIVSLAFADMLNAFVLIPMYIASKLRGNAYCSGETVCYWWIMGDSITTLGSLLSLFFIAIDRFIAISYPFKHQSIFTTRNIKILVVIIWLFAFLYSFTGIFQWQENQYSIKGALFALVGTNNICVNNNRLFYVVGFGIYAVLLVTMTFTYSVILNVALTQIRAIETTQVDLSRSSPDADPTMIRKERIKRMRKKELKATKSVAIVYMFFIVCWLPLFIVVTILEFDKTFFPRMQSSNMALFLFVWYGVVQILPMISTMVNPIIYSFSNNQFKNAFKAVYIRMMQRVELPSYSQTRSTRAQSGISLASTACNSPSVMQGKDGAKIDLKRCSQGLSNEGYQMESNLSK